MNLSHYFKDINNDNDYVIYDFENYYYVIYDDDDTIIDQDYLYDEAMDAYEEIKKIFDNDMFMKTEAYILYVSSGAWQGRREYSDIIPAVNMRELMSKFCDGDLNIYKNKDMYCFELSHHDATNYYYVRKVTIDLSLDELRELCDYLLNEDELSIARFEISGNETLDDFTKDELLEIIFCNLD